MYETLLTIVIITYFIVSKKIDEWTTISALGFRTETPPLFMSNESLYHGLRIILFLMCLFLSYQIGEIIIGSVVTIAIWFFSTLIGQKSAFKSYREIMGEFGDDDANLSDADLRKKIV